MKRTLILLVVVDIETFSVTENKNCFLDVLFLISRTRNYVSDTRTNMPLELI